MKKLCLKKCSLSDASTLQQISKETFFQTFAPYNSSEIMSAFLSSAYSLEKLSKELKNENSSFFFLYYENQLAGYLKINQAPSQTDINDSDSLEIERFYVLKPFQDKGLGTFLMNKSIAIAKKLKKSYVWLGVWERNEKAKAFYKKHGFYQIGAHSFFVGPDEQTDFIMRKDLSE